MIVLKKIGYSFGKYLNVIGNFRSDNIKTIFCL